MARKTSKKKSCEGWCAPTIIYFSLAVVSMILNLFATNSLDNNMTGGQNQLAITIGSLIGILAWTSILYWLCSRCHNKVAWVVLLFPFIMSVVLAFLYFSGMMKNSDVVTKQVAENFANRARM